ncbi:MAG TPA: hypothetical protein VL053_10530 [Arachidicoccus sp.]|nr:hypothetical protein [Arachidicoccus sp.]
MNIVTSIVQAGRFQRQDAVGIARHAAGSQARFEKLMACMLSDQDQLCKRAAWCVCLAVQIKPTRLSKQVHMEVLVNLLGKQTVLPAVLRSCLGILRDAEIPLPLQEKAIFHCFEIVQDQKQPIAIRSSALQILGKMAVSIPEIKDEIKAIIAFHEEHFSPGLLVAARNVLKLIH